MPAADSPVRVERIVDDAVMRSVQELRVSGDQYRFVGDTAFNLGNSLRDPVSEAMAVFAGETVVGFYRLAFAPRAIAGRDWPEPAVGLRAFVIGLAYQGCGFGAGALTATSADLRRRHPGRRLLALTVNCTNRAAIAMYRQAGFTDTGELYLAGSSGPQHVMLYRLQPQALT